MLSSIMYSCYYGAIYPGAILWKPYISLLIPTIKLVMKHLKVVQICFELLTMKLGCSLYLKALLCAQA